MSARATFTLIALSVVAAACAPRPEPPPPVDVAAVKKFIEGENAKFIAALKRGDSTAGAMNYAEDAIMMQPDEPALRGRGAIAGNLGAAIRSRTVTYEEATTDDVMVKDDIAVETGHFVFTITPTSPKNAKPVSGKGKYLTVWKKQADGGWKIIRDINNSDGPAGK